MASPSPSYASSEQAMLMLGRLDGRLQNSPWADIWLARARLQGAAQLAGLAGVPIDVRHLQDWISGRTPPPRASEGLSDPVSVAAVFHLAIEASTGDQGPLARATLNVLRTVLDDRSEAEVWAGSDLAYFGPAWRQARADTVAPYPSPSLRAIADRIVAMLKAVVVADQAAVDVTTIDGRTLMLEPRARDRAWLVASHIPAMLRHAGLTLGTLPSLTLLPKFPPHEVGPLTDIMTRSLLTSCQSGLKDLDWIERQGSKSLAVSATRRSRAPLLARLALAYPGLRPAAVTRLLQVTPQGARKLLATVR
ncbi:MAG: hypothetical protein A2095_00840 [Sphingomonadales bacterium GWF1_63_6]|nr:MAG: hypothetical protein A2095_00840 [Sphingomonadales bacterium GWF1_63_6]